MNTSDSHILNKSFSLEKLLLYAIIICSITITPAINITVFQTLVMSIILSAGLFISVYKSRKIYFSKASIVLLVLNLLFVINILISSNKSITINVVSYWLLSSLLYLYLLQNKDILKTSVIVNSLIVAAILLFAFNCYISLQTSSNIFIENEKTLRIYYDRNNNFITGFMQLCVLFFTIMYKRNKLQIGIQILLLLYFVGYILNSESQTSRVLLFLVPFMTLQFQGAKTSIKLLVGIIFSAIVAVLFFNNRLGKIIVEYQGLDFRYDFWSGSLTMIQDNLFTGVGLGNWMFHIPKYTPIPTGITHAHNLVLELTSEAGIFSMLLLIIFIITAISASFKNGKSNDKQNDTPKYIYTFAIISILIYCMIYGVTYHQFYNYSPIFGLLFIFLSILDKNNLVFSLDQKQSKIICFATILILGSGMTFYNSIILSKQVNSKNLNKKKPIDLGELYNSYTYNAYNKHKKLLSELFYSKTKNKQTKNKLLFELIQQKPYDVFYIDRYCTFQNRRKKYTECLEKMAAASHLIETDYNYKLKLAEQYYLARQKKKARRIINEIKAIESLSIEKLGFDEYNKILKLKTDAFNLQQKYQ